MSQTEMESTEASAPRTSATSPEPEERLRPPVRIEVDPERVSIDHQGLKTTMFIARLPDGAIVDDLKDPSIWKQVQRSRSVALRRFDQVLAIAYDESFLAQGVVTETTGDAAAIQWGRVVNLKARVSNLYADDLYRVEFDGATGGYLVVRKSDGQTMTPVVYSEGQAKELLFRLYGTPGTS